MLLLTFILLLFTITLYIRADKTKLYCSAIMIFTSVCYISNEVFSIFHKLDQVHLFMMYLFMDIILAVFIFNKVKNKKRQDWAIELQDVRKNVKNNMVGILFFAFWAGIFVLAIFTIPYNWDSMTYHLPRIMEWIQNKSVAHYATYDVRRVTSPVLPAFINLQAYLFGSSNDSIFNLLQYSSYITNAVLIYYVCKKLALEKKYCFMGMLLFVSMPIAFGEALSTQVDQFSTMWLLMFVYLLLDLLKETYRLRCNKNTISDVILLSCCIAYGYLAKPSVMFGMVFFAVWLLIICIKKKESIKEVLTLILIALIVIIIIISPEVIRNIQTFGSISDPIAGKRQLIGTGNPLYVLVNGLMNFTMNLPNKYIDWKDILEHGVYWIAYILKVDITSPLIAEDGVAFYLHKAGRYNHDTAINPVVVIAAAAAFIWFLYKIFKKEKLKIQEYYILFASVSFLFFCCIVRWEPFVTRYMLSYLALLCPAVVIWLFKMKKRVYADAIYGILVFISVCELLNLSVYHYNICKDGNSMEERTAGYFTVNNSAADNYVELKKELEELECDSIGLYLSMAATYEYPIWTMIDENVHMESILTENATTRYENTDFVPEYIIVINKNAEDIVNYKQKYYVCYKEIDTDFAIWKLEKE